MEEQEQHFWLPASAINFLTFHAINVEFIYKVYCSVNTGHDSISLNFLTSNPFLPQHLISPGYLFRTLTLEIVTPPNVERAEAYILGGMCLLRRSPLPLSRVCPWTRVTNIAQVLLGPFKT